MFATCVGDEFDEDTLYTQHTNTHCSDVVRPNLFNPIKELRRQSFERLLGRLKVTRVFVSSHLTHTGCVIGYETIWRIWRQRQATPIWKRGIRCERRGLIDVEVWRFRVDYEESRESIRDSLIVRWCTTDVLCYIHKYTHNIYNAIEYPPSFSILYTEMSMQLYAR